MTHLVATEDNVWGGGVGVGGELVQPVPGADQGVVIGQVEHQQEAHGVTEEGRGQTAKPFLTSSVPQLQLDPLTSSLEFVRIID